MSCARCGAVLIITGNCGKTEACGLPCACLTEYDSAVSADHFDIAIIGGGINGSAIARDAAGRGLKTILIEQDDLASATSSASTKLIHGGLRYLEYYEFRLVREALIEREVLLRSAPHIIEPLRFVLPHHKALRPRWLIRLGLFIYDHLGGRKLLPGTTTIDLRTDAAGKSLKPGFTTAFEYSDCRVDDSRLTILNALDAHEKGAEIALHTRCSAGRREAGRWHLELTPQSGAGVRQITAGALVNAAGPWVSGFLNGVLGLNTQSRIRMVKGSHIITRRLFDHERAYIFQNADNRIIFAIPYQDNFTLIGTTDVDFDADPAQVVITDDEINYLCEQASEYFAENITPDDVRATYSGVRPLYDDGASEAQAATRDYVLELDSSGNDAPVLSVFGGKITTARHLAEDALGKLAPWFSAMRPAWTVSAALPGGDFAVDGIDALTGKIAARCQGLPGDVAARLARTYGTRAFGLLEKAATVEGLGRHFGAGLYQREVDYLCAAEWAASAEDILWRRTRLGLKLTADERKILHDYVQKAGAKSLTATAHFAQKGTGHGLHSGN